MKTPEEPFEFGLKRENEERRDGGCGIVFDPKSQMYAVTKEGQNGFLRLAAGGVNPGEDIQEGILREVTEETGLYDFLYVEKIAEAFTHYHNSLKNVNRVARATCFLVILNSVDLRPVKLEEHEKFRLEWNTVHGVLENWLAHNQNKDYDHWIYFMKKGVRRATELGYDITSAID